MPFQQFRTKSVANDGKCLYQIRLCAPVISALEIHTYTFPLSPSSLRFERSSMSSYVDVQGSLVNQGVKRVVDVYGLAPPIITIEGTTGWDTHLMDGDDTTGLDSIKQLATFLATYAELNQVQRLAGIPFLFTLEFYDYFTNNFWVIEPIGPQIFQQDSARPLLSYYRFRWAAIHPAGFLGDLLDTMDTVFNISSQLSSIGLSETVGNFMNNYSPTGLIDKGVAAVKTLF
jgi:hypothetical protein